MERRSSIGLAAFVGAWALTWPALAWSQAGASQNAIAKEVQHELVALPFYMVFDHLTFRMVAGTVTLAGQVTRATLKSDAEKVVKQMPGVRNVINEIEVLPLTPVDEKLRLAEYLAVLGDPQLNQYALRAIAPIHIVVRNTTVILEGSVATEADKTEAFTQASTVHGVTSVTNHLLIAP